MRAFSLLSAAQLGVSAAGPIETLCSKHDAAQVEVKVFSGTDNPVFRVEGDDWKNLCSQIQGSNGNLTVPTCRVLGFTGWEICGEKQTDCVLLRGNKDTDGPLLDALTKRKALVDLLTDDAMKHITEELDRLHQSNGGDQECANEQPIPAPSNSNGCSGPILGPDDPTKVHYDPQNDDGGCFLTMQSKNNCYDYGNDIVTNTFAQPGRGSGVCPPGTRPCVKNTCDDVKNAAISDGLQWVGTELPTTLPEQGHYVSLHIWPNSNFHWIRMDADKYWSHKPGGTAVRNVDNNNQKITDPSKSDFSPWTQHCGYMLAVPSMGQINNVLV